MVTREALRQAIADLERLAAGMESPHARPTVSILARLYTTYAQVTLEAYGISIDLPGLCGDHLAHEFHGMSPADTRH
jgi:hypothetical protein